MAAAAVLTAPHQKKNCYGRLDERTIWTRIWQGIAAASMGVNIAAMVIEASTVAIVAGLFACIIAPVVIYLQHKLQDTDSTYSEVIVVTM